MPNMTVGGSAERSRRTAVLTPLLLLLQVETTAALPTGAGPGRGVERQLQGGVATPSSSSPPPPPLLMSTTKAMSPFAELLALVWPSSIEGVDAQASLALGALVLGIIFAAACLVLGSVSWWAMRAALCPVLLDDEERKERSWVRAVERAIVPRSLRLNPRTGKRRKWWRVKWCSELPSAADLQVELRFMINGWGASLRQCMRCERCLPTWLRCPSPPAWLVVEMRMMGNMAAHSGGAVCRGFARIGGRIARGVAQLCACIVPASLRQAIGQSAVGRAVATCCGGLARAVRELCSLRCHGCCKCGVALADSKDDDKQSLLEAGGERSDGAHVGDPSSSPRAGAGLGGLLQRWNSFVDALGTTDGRAEMLQVLNPITFVFGGGHVPKSRAQRMTTLGGDLDDLLEAERNARLGCLQTLYRDWVVSRRHFRKHNFSVWRTFNHWQAACHEVNERKRAMRSTLRMLALRHERAALAGWLETHSQRNALLGKMRRALRGLIMMRELRSFNAWHAWADARRAKEARIRAALARVSPEGRAMLRALDVLKQMLAKIYKVRRVMAGFADRAYIAAWNKWVHVIEERAASMEQMRMALTRMSPDGRAMLKALERLQACQKGQHAMHRAVRAFTMMGPRKAFTSWREMMARRQAGLQSTVWLAAQRGHRVGTLQSMLMALDPAIVAQLVTATDELGMTPLLWAAKRGFADAVEVLLAFSGGDQDALVCAQDAEGSTALHHACRKAHNDVVLQLLLAGAPVGAMNVDRSTPLHWAARKNNLDAIRLLLAHGADPAARNKWGATALDNAKFADHMAAIALLASDKPTREAAESKLVLERKLRPTTEERQQKLADLAAGALAKREANKARAEQTRVVRAESEAAAQEQVKTERRQRRADRALAEILEPVKSSTPRMGGGAGGLLGGLFGSPDEPDDEEALLEAAIREAKEAGNGSVKGAAGERLRAAEQMLELLRAQRPGGTLASPLGRSSAAPLYYPGGSPPSTGGFASPSPTATNRDLLRSMSPQKDESPVERTMRRQKLAKKMKR